MDVAWVGESDVGGGRGSGVEEHGLKGVGVWLLAGMMDVERVVGMTRMVWVRGVSLFVDIF